MWKSPSVQLGHIPDWGLLPQSKQLMASPHGQWSWGSDCFLLSGCPVCQRTARMGVSVSLVCQRKTPLTPPLNFTGNSFSLLYSFILGNSVFYTACLSSFAPLLLYLLPVCSHLDGKRWQEVYFPLAQAFQLVWPSGRDHLDSELRIWAKTVQLKEQNIYEDRLEWKNCLEQRSMN